jgi:hypothetical protein
LNSITEVRHYRSVRIPFDPIARIIPYEHYKFKDNTV